jgi:hypothetical protein
MPRGILGIKYTTVNSELRKLRMQRVAHGSTLTIGRGLVINHEISERLREGLNRLMALSFDDEVRLSWSKAARNVLE